MNQQTTALKDAWEEQAQNWVKWARTPGHDSYWQFHRDQFFQLLPEPGKLTIDVGCGEGRVCRDMKARGHKIIAVDASETLIKYAKEADAQGDYRLGNAAKLPVDDACADLVVAFMSLQDVDDLQSVIKEIARVLQPGGRVCLAIVHPINSAGKFENEDADSRFIIEGNYLDQFNYHDTFERDGLAMTFHSQHRPLETYSRALEAAGLLMEAIRENPVPAERAADSPRSVRWTRLPLFLHIRAVKL